MIVPFLRAVLPNTCGVGVFGRFSDVDYLPLDRSLEKISSPGGCGWVVAGFTDRRVEFEKAYHILRKRWKLVYQSPVRTNRRSDNKFFFCIFDSRSKP